VKTIKPIIWSILSILFVTNPKAAELEILHWWTSDGEKSAAHFLKQSLVKVDVEWLDAAIEGGGGEGAMAVLKSRVLQGAAPGAAQIIGPDISAWADLNFLGQFNIVALAHDWPKVLHPTVDSLIRVNDQYVAVPFGIHRINRLWINKSLLLKTGMKHPTSWYEFFELAQAFQRLGVTPISHGKEPWQNMTLFENVVLSVGGPLLFNQVFVDHLEHAILSDDFSQALRIVAQLKRYMGSGINGRTWQQATSSVVDGTAGMQIMGDWVLGELEAWKAREKVVCETVPNTESFHLYSIDTMVMFNDTKKTSYETQLKFAEIVTQTEQQLGYNLRKGSVPVRSDIELTLLDECSQSSYQVFRDNEGRGELSPSLAHSMAAESEVEDVFVSIIHSFFQTPETPVVLIQNELVKNLKSIRR
jgi:glucose/mannose transport system substrate-binding protein